MAMQTSMFSGMPQNDKGELLGGPFTKKRIDLFLRAVDMAFPYMDLASKVKESSSSVESLVEQGRKVAEILEKNPNLSPEDFLKLNI